MNVFLDLKSIHYVQIDCTTSADDCHDLDQLLVVKEIHKNLEVEQEIQMVV